MLEMRKYKQKKKHRNLKIYNFLSLFFCIFYWISTFALYGFRNPSQSLMCSKGIHRNHNHIMWSIMFCDVSLMFDVISGLSSIYNLCRCLSFHWFVLEVGGCQYYFKVDILTCKSKEKLLVIKCSWWNFWRYLLILSFSIEGSRKPQH